MTTIDYEYRVGTWILSKGFMCEHRALRRLIVKHKKEFKTFGEVFENTQKVPNMGKGGRPINEFVLNTDQILFLCSTISTTRHTVGFKKLLITLKDNMSELIDEILKKSDQKRDNSGHVYLIKNSRGQVKIGRSIDPDHRIKCIETQNGEMAEEIFISEVVLDYYTMEKYLHRIFSKFDRTGEWFNIDFNEAKLQVESLCRIQKAMPKQTKYEELKPKQIKLI